MATETFYEQRMKELQQAKIETTAQSNPLLQRPQRQAETLAGPSPMPQESPEETPDYMKSDFFMNSERFRAEDPNFTPMMENFTKLAMGLKKMVDKGMMPLPIAKQRLEQYINDHRQGYSKQMPQGEQGVLPPAQDETVTEEATNGVL
ncbi:hypothetical protein LAh8_82 [Aeromonas phage LAh_8]|uniref:Uncharacterized protein n=2 Tax=Lahexavirus TaxID=2843411 RepID=A0A513ZZX1_9CAUD|nr:hypothetical protein HWC30_gp024 [Aeromonas phage LAh_6]YP_009847421.1 hypothetical protein HWC31_gp083 [Aeromonas phage LAh_8]QDH46545.1 hypothetical protein LAh6_24 [Aeromonas phage LAh_6]QDH46782.1 hypothetical protein LAh8_82 [Aeromonas phage LAh_8]